MATKAVHSSEYKIILGRLKKARQEAKLKQADVTKKLQKPQSYLSKVESGERRLDIIELKKLAQVYRKPVSYFVD